MVMQARGNTEYGAIKMATARKYQIKKSEVALSTHRASLDGIKAIYDKATEYTYLIPEITGENMVSFAGGILKTDKQEIELAQFNFDRGNYAICSQYDFDKGFTLISPLEVVFRLGYLVRWRGDFPKVVPPNSTTGETGGIGNLGWRPVSISVGGIDINAFNGYSGINFHWGNDSFSRMEAGREADTLMNFFKRSKNSDLETKVSLPMKSGILATQEWVKETDFLTWIPNDADLFEWISDKKSYFYKSGSGIKNTPVKTEPWYDYVWINHGINTHGVLYAIGATGRVFVVTQVNAKWGNWKEAGFKGDSWIADKTVTSEQAFKSNISSPSDIRVSPDGKKHIALRTSAGNVFVKWSNNGVTEHSGGLPNISGLIAMASQVIGIEQVWKDMRGERKLATLYTNNGEQPIMVSIACQSTSESSYVNPALEVNGVMVANQKATVREEKQMTYLTVTAIVPPKANYRLLSPTANSNLNISIWSELR